MSVVREVLSVLWGGFGKIPFAGPVGGGTLCSCLTRMYSESLPNTSQIDWTLASYRIPCDLLASCELRAESSPCVIYSSYKYSDLRFQKTCLEAIMREVDKFPFPASMNP